MERNRPRVVMEEVSDADEIAQARRQRERFDRNAAWLQRHSVAHRQTVGTAQRTVRRRPLTHGSGHLRGVSPGNRLERELNQKETLYMTVANQYELRRIKRAEDAAGIEVIDRAAAPKPETRSRQYIITIGGLLGSFLGVCCWARSCRKDLLPPEAARCNTMRFTVTIDRDEDGAWVVECPAIPGCVSQGSTKEDALNNIHDAIEQCLQVRAEQGLPLTIETRQVEVAA